MNNPAIISDNGCFVEIGQTQDELLPVKLSFGVKRYKQGFKCRVIQACRAFVDTIYYRDLEYDIYLNSDELCKLKEVVRSL